MRGQPSTTGPGWPDRRRWCDGVRKRPCRCRPVSGLDDLRSPWWAVFDHQGMAGLNSAIARCSERHFPPLPPSPAVRDLRRNGRPPSSARLMKCVMRSGSAGHRLAQPLSPTERLQCDDSWFAAEYIAGSRAWSSSTKPCGSVALMGSFLRVACSTGSERTHPRPRPVGGTPRATRSSFRVSSTLSVGWGFSPPSSPGSSTRRLTSSCASA